MSEYPHIRKTGRYLFYAVCAIGAGVIVSLATAAFFARDVAIQIVGPVSIAAFIALRDLEKNAEARGRKQGQRP